MKLSLVLQATGTSPHVTATPSVPSTYTTCAALSPSPTNSPVAPGSPVPPHGATPVCFSAHSLLPFPLQIPAFPQDSHTSNPRPCPPPTPSDSPSAPADGITYFLMESRTQPPSHPLLPSRNLTSLLPLLPYTPPFPPLGQSSLHCNAFNNGSPSKPKLSHFLTLQAGLFLPLHRHTSSKLPRLSVFFSSPPLLPLDLTPVLTETATSTQHKPSGLIWVLILLDSLAASGSASPSCCWKHSLPVASVSRVSS